MKLGNLKWLLTASLGLGATALIPATASAHESVETNVRLAGYYRDDCNVTRDVSFDQLPYRVRCAVERVGRGDQVELLQFVRTQDKEFFRVVIDHPGCNTLFRIAPDGRVLSAEELHPHYAPAPPPHYRDHDRWERDRRWHDSDRRYDRD